MDILQEVIENFIKEIMGLSLAEGLTPFLDQAESRCTKFILEFTRGTLRLYDQYLLKHKEERRGYEVVKKDVSRTLETKFGALHFLRRYYVNRWTGEYSYLLDKLLDIKSYERIERGLGAELCTLACSHSYQVSSQLASGGRVSKQTVMQLVRQVDEEPLVREKSKKPVRSIHLQCDEDHVAMQDGSCRLTKLCVIHEAIKPISGQKKHYLPDKFIVVEDKSCTSNEKYWFKIADAIEDRYGNMENLKIYIHGDGASWIKAGLGYLPHSKFVLDKYHFSKYLTPVAGDVKEAKALLWEAVKSRQPKQVEAVLEGLIDQGICTEDKAEAFHSYYQNNRQGISIWYSDPESGRSCAEGLVSHILSDRLSSRPKAWGEKGLGSVTRLRAHLLNGGTITAQDFKRPQTTLEQPYFKDEAKQRAGQYVSDFMPCVSNALKMVKAGTSTYHVFDTIKNGGYLF